MNSETNSLHDQKIVVLCIEDDVAIRRLIGAALSDTEFKLIECENGLDGIAAIAKQKPEIVLLDMGLPDMDGVSVIKEIRSWSSVPVIFVSAQGAEDDKINALEAGADDYVTKPFSVNELLARIRVAWRRTQGIKAAHEDAVLRFGELEIDQLGRSVKRSNEVVHLTPIEYKLLVFLAKHAGRVVTQRQILAAVWGDEYSEEAQYLRVYVGYLRKKLEDDPGNPKLIMTEPRVGYRLLG
ncbi:MAG: response regulator [Chthonomonas sp.]|nr:response regulator [Chthonomonas sp.]